MLWKLVFCRLFIYLFYVAEQYTGPGGDTGIRPIRQLLPYQCYSRWSQCPLIKCKCALQDDFHPPQKSPNNVDNGGEYEKLLIWNKIPDEINHREIFYKKTEIWIMKSVLLNALLFFSIMIISPTFSHYCSLILLYVVILFT